jgi:hypothetical protein
MPRDAHPVQPNRAPKFEQPASMQPTRRPTDSFPLNLNQLVALIHLARAARPLIPPLPKHAGRVPESSTAHHTRKHDHLLVRSIKIK